MFLCFMIFKVFNFFSWRCETKIYQRNKQYAQANKLMLIIKVKCPSFTLVLSLCTSQPLSYSMSMHTILHTWFIHCDGFYMTRSYFEGLRKEEWSKELKDYLLHIGDLYIKYNRIIWKLNLYFCIKSLKVLILLTCQTHTFLSSFTDETESCSIS